MPFRPPVVGLGNEAGVGRDLLLLDYAAVSTLTLIFVVSACMKTPSLHRLEGKRSSTCSDRC